MSSELTELEWAAYEAWKTQARFKDRWAAVVEVVLKEASKAVTNVASNYHGTPEEIPVDSYTVYTCAQAITRLKEASK